MRTWQIPWNDGYATVTMPCSTNSQFWDEVQVLTSAELWYMVYWKAQRIL